MLCQICLNPFWYVKNLVYNQIFLLFFQLLFGLFPLSQKLTTFPRPSACWCYYPLYSLAFITPITQSFCSIERCKRRGKKTCQTEKKEFLLPIPYIHPPLFAPFPNHHILESFFWVWFHLWRFPWETILKSSISYWKLLCSHSCFISINCNPSLCQIVILGLHCMASFQ